MEVSLSPNPSRVGARALPVLAAAVLLGAPASAAGQTADGWSQYQGDGAHLASAPEGPEPPYAIRWTLPAPAGDALGPAVIAGDRAFSLGREAVYAIDTATGEVLWETPRAGPRLASPALVDGTPSLVLFVDGAADEGEGSSPTPSATPSVPASPPASSTASAPADAGGSVVALDATTGEEAWTAPLAASSRTGVTVSGETALVGQQDGTVVALDVTSGEVRWTRRIGARVEIPIAAAEDTVVALAADADAREVRIASLSLESGEPRFPPLVSRIGSSAASAPTIADGQVVVGMPDRLVHAIALEDGTERWASLALTAFSPTTALAAADAEVYAADLGGGVYAFDAATGERRWSHQLNGLVVRGAPAVAGGSVLVGLDDGRLVAIDRTTGHLVWQGRAPGLTGTIAVGEDVVVVVKGGREAGLVAYEVDPAGVLLDVRSPSELELGSTLVTAALGAAAALAVALVPGLLVRRRYGTRFGEPRDGDHHPDGLDDAEADDR